MVVIDVGARAVSPRIGACVVNASSCAQNCEPARKSFLI